jgi:dTDP-4-dehydrorhamnose 3,5-epimerase
MKIESRIEGVRIIELKQIVDERGAVLHMLRSDAPLFSRFGEIYFSLVNRGVIKAWKRHKEMTQHFAVPVGRIRLVLFDDRPGTKSHGTREEYELGRPDRYLLIRIPPMIWYGFQGISEIPAVVANCTDLPHDPGESEQKSPAEVDFGFDWK